jgi:hypothetical protein
LLAYPKKHNKAIRLNFILKNMSSLIETKFKFNLFQFSTFLSAKFRQTAAFVIWLCSSQYANLFKCWTRILNIAIHLLLFLYTSIFGMELF